MTKTVYTNYWVSRIGDVRKEHGSYKTEEEAIDGIKAWWELHGESYPNVKFNRTNTGALEMTYRDENSFYRIEKRETEEPLPKRSYRLKSSGETEALRMKYLLDDDFYVFDELAEPYRDLIMMAMADIQKARQFIYDEQGRPVKDIS